MFRTTLSRLPNLELTKKNSWIRQSLMVENYHLFYQTFVPPLPSLLPSFLLLLSLSFSFFFSYWRSFYFCHSLYSKSFQYVSYIFLPSSTLRLCSLSFRTRSRSASLSYLSSSLSFSRFSSLSRSLSLLFLSCLLSGLSVLSCSLVGLLSLFVSFSFLFSADSTQFEKKSF